MNGSERTRYALPDFLDFEQILVGALGDSPVILADIVLVARFIRDCPLQSVIFRGTHVRAAVCH